MRKFELLLIMLAISFFMSCEEDIAPSVMPVFRGFDVVHSGDGDLPNIGDTITVTAVQSSIGSYIYNAQYDWTGKSYVDTMQYTRKVVYSLNPENPYFKYIVPAGNDGKIEFDFYATFDFSRECDEPVTTEGKSNGYIISTSSKIIGKTVGSITVFCQK